MEIHGNLIESSSMPVNSPRPGKRHRNDAPHSGPPGRDAIPLYERVKQYVTSRMADGRLAVGDRVPSENELSKVLGVSRVTVNRAMHELASRGVVARVRGSGTFVRPPPAQSSLMEIRNIADEVTARGRSHHLRLITLERVDADQALAAFFSEDVGATVFHSVVVHFEDELPIQFEERFVNPRFAPDYLRQDFSRRTTSEYLHTLSDVTEVEHTVCAIRPDSRIRKHLGVDAAEPCLQLIRDTWVGRLATSKNTFIHPGSRYRLGSRYRVRSA